MSGVETRWNSLFVPTYSTPKLEIVRGRGAHVTDANGRSYLDLLAGLAVNILGHAHPAVVKAVADQVATLGHTSNLYANAPSLELAERLQALVPSTRAALFNSGTEANEFALKLARRHAHATARPDGVVVSFVNGFHGRTMGSLSLTGQFAYHKDFGPLVDQIVHLPVNDADAMEQAFERHPVVAVFSEAVQAEGGVVPMAPRFARTLGRLCREHDALLVADEVQTGVGRTGAFLAHSRLGLAPDVVTLAKAIGGGLPLAAALVRDDLAPLMGPGSHGCTFGGNPIACAAANAMLEVYEREQLAERAAILGPAFAAALDDELVDIDVATRGMGLLLGVPLPTATASSVVGSAAATGLLVGQAGSSVVRLTPPLVIDEDELLAAAEPLAQAIVQTVLPGTPNARSAS